MSDSATKNTGAEHCGEGMNEEYLEDIVQKQIDKLGPKPTLLQAVSVILKQSAKAEYEARKACHKFEQDLTETKNMVHSNQININNLKEKVVQSEQVMAGIQGSQQNLETRVNQMEFYVNKTYYLACENRQRGSKGNFIVNGRHVPYYQEGENLLMLTRDLIYKKYRIDVNPAEFKFIHRLAGGRILFSLHSRMPGLGYDKLVQIINTNPNPSLAVYLSIQLFEPYSDLFYIARRLKFFKKISYYRLDYDGVT